MGTKARYDYTPQLRRAMFDGLRQMARDEGKTLTEVCAGWWREDWKKAADVLSKIAPRELKAETHDHKHLHLHGEVSESVAFIEGALGTRESLALETLSSDGPVFPVEVLTEET